MRTVVARKCVSPSILGDQGLQPARFGMAVLVVALALAMERTHDHNARFLGPMPTNLVSMGTGLAPVFFQGGQCTGKDNAACPVDEAGHSTSLSEVCNSNSSTGFYGTRCAGDAACEEVCELHNHAPYLWDTDPANGDQPHPKLRFKIAATCSALTEEDEGAMKRYFANRIGRGPRLRYPDLGRPGHLKSGAEHNPNDRTTHAWDYDTGVTGGGGRSIRLYAYDLEKDADVLTSGTCGDLLDRAKCDSLAAHTYGQPAGAKSTVCSGANCAPQGCYLYTTGEVWYNSDKSGPCTTDRKCLCGRHAESMLLSLSPAPPPPLATTTSYTGCNDWNGQQIRYLDRHNPQCTYPAAMQKWYGARHGCGGNGGEIQYVCTTPVYYGSESTHSTGCNENGYLRYLDRQDFDCGTDKVLMRWHFGAPLQAQNKRPPRPLLPPCVTSVHAPNARQPTAVARLGWTTRAWRPPS